MHSSKFDFTSVTLADDKFTFNYLTGNGNDQTAGLSNLPRAATGSGATMSVLVDKAVTLDS